MNDMLSVTLSAENEFSTESTHVSIQSGKKYSVSTEVAGIYGEPFCGYFGIVILDKNITEIGRKIQWLNDFSGINKNIKIIFRVPEDAEYICGIFRINRETPMRAKCSYLIQPLTEINIKEVDLDVKENYDIPENFLLPRSKELTFEEESILEKKVVWLLSQPRSGTTWLGERLLVHPENIIWSEPLIGEHLGVYTTDGIPQGKVSIERLYDINEKRDSYFFSLQHKNNWLPYLRKMFLQRVYSHAQNLTKNIIIKEPNGGIAADILLECFPASKLILLLRDGRDVVDSRMAMHEENSWAGLTPFRNQQEREMAIRFYSHLWIKVFEWNITAYQKHDENLRLLIKYEELRNNTINELGKIYNFLDIQMENDNLKKIVDMNDFSNIPASEKGSGKFNRTAKVGGWRNNFSQEEQELMNSIMGKKLMENGYIV